MVEAGIIISFRTCPYYGPKWVQKIENNQEDKIRTTFPKTDQKELVIPDSMWNTITRVPGWFPVV